MAQHRSDRLGNEERARAYNTQCSTVEGEKSHQSILPIWALFRATNVRPFSALLSLDWAWEWDPGGIHHRRPYSGGQQKNGQKKWENEQRAGAHSRRW